MQNMLMELEASLVQESTRADRAEAEVRTSLLYTLNAIRSIQSWCASKEAKSIMGALTPQQFFLHRCITCG